MKKLWRILVIGAFAAMLVLPQTAAAGVKFGIKGGANIANVNGDFMEALADWKSTVGFCGGIFLELNFGRILTIQPEVLYTMKGADTGTESSNSTTSRSRSSSSFGSPSAVSIPSSSPARRSAST